MLGFLQLMIALLRVAVRDRGDLVAEILLLRQQLTVRSRPRRRLRTRDRLKGGKMRARRSGGTLVHVVQTAQDRVRTDGAGGGAGGGMRGLQPEAPVRPLGVVVAHELSEYRV